MTQPSEKLARLNDYIDKWAAHHPDHVAMVQFEDEKSITYKQFASLVDFFCLAPSGYGY